MMSGMKLVLEKMKNINIYLHLGQSRRNPYYGPNGIQPMAVARAGFKGGFEFFKFMVDIIMGVAGMVM
jgi:hypothetical protein